MSAEESIVRKLDYFHRNQKIPHILFYGPTNSAKDQIVSNFINQIYGKHKFNIKHNVLFVSCSGKGIKFIRDEIKTFAKMHIQLATVPTDRPEEADQEDTFKTVVLMNADFLTDDAQSALRRSIELFSYNTRFFLLVENKSKLLKPILSRFCEIYVPPHRDVPVIVSKAMPQMGADLATLLQGCADESCADESDGNKAVVAMVTKWINAGYSSYDFLQTICKDSLQGVDNRCICTQFLFHKLKTEYRCEKLFLWTLVDFYLYRSYADLQRICCV